MPILFSVVVAAGLASMHNSPFQTNEAGFLIPIALLVFVLEVGYFISAKKTPDSEPSDDPLTPPSILR